ncbi:methionine gamma-lyase family protein [Paludicola sp. MB14-C6]|uniref:methionine gamma-lyase family protein n=1 Tax=Paludihabitans sp. MB14-C6 TaxID=3070656 RepID=UPI0027DD26D3|nr:methionine gamma-lyase family protein [Paludicola sp. MB14-C6]WMJ23876.1 methionine gamma-lyase family protein [Paludicola sp. MB14-C6]
MLKEQFSISDELLQLSKKAEERCKEAFARIDEIQLYNEAKVLKAFSACKVSETHLAGSTGYGYGDRGREVLDEVFAMALGAEDALVRHNFVSGTHALTVGLFGLLRAGDTMVSITGKPYDTMEEVIGIRGEGNGSLKDFGVHYKQVDLTNSGEPNIDEIKKAVVGAKVAYIQRSRGYSLRESLTIAKIAQLVSACKEVNPEVIIVVDNCYGEFVEKQEPVEVGADLIVGSLIKNPGGGIAQTGGYIAGRKDLVELCSYRLTCVGMGKEVGCTLDQSRGMFMGIFFAPSVVANAIKTSVFALSLFDSMGYKVYPAFDAYRTDIIAAIELKTPENLIAFCQGIQKGSPVDSFVTPEPWEMPGYESKVIMAAGAFTMGASIELSADAPLREPYAVWLQGGLTYNTGKLGILLAAQQMMNLK